MENKQRGVLIIGLGLVMLFGGVLLAARCWDQIYPNSASLQINPGSMQVSSDDTGDVSNEEWVVDEMPVIPSSDDLASRTPELLAKSFYDWYTAAQNYSGYKRYQKMKGLSKEEPVRVYELAKSSPFVSSSFAENIEKHMGMYDPVLCTNDPERNVVKEHSLKSAKGNMAQVEVIKGYEGNDSTTKISVLLKKEGHWKIDDIVCDFQNKKE